MRARRSLVALTTAVGVVAITAMGHAQERCAQASASATGFLAAHQLRKAREQLRLCIATSCADPLRADCTKRLLEAQASIPAVVFDVSDESGRPLTGAALYMDGALLAKSLGDQAVEVESGSHTFRFELPGRYRVTRTFTFRDGEGRHEAIVLPPASPPPPAVH